MFTCVHKYFLVPQIDALLFRFHYFLVQFSFHMSCVTCRHRSSACRFFCFNTLLKDKKGKWWLYVFMHTYACRAVPLYFFSVNIFLLVCAHKNWTKETRMKKCKGMTSESGKKETIFSWWPWTLLFHVL